MRCCSFALSHSVASKPHFVPACCCGEWSGCPKPTFQKSELSGSRALSPRTPIGACHQNMTKGSAHDVRLEMLVCARNSWTPVETPVCDCGSVGLNFMICPTDMPN